MVLKSLFRFFGILIVWGNVVTAGNECGRSTLSSLIVKKGDLPWLALESLEGEVYCVAYLVSSQHVLLTANCVNQIVDAIPNNYFISIGQFSARNDDKSALKIPVSRVVIHPNYVPDKLENNLAIAFLRSPTDLTPICLPSAKRSINDIFSKRLYAIGWEPVFENERSSPVGTASIAPIVPISSPECNDAYSNELAVSNGQYFCVKSKGDRGPCDVDYDGSGVMIQSRGKWSLRGIKLLSQLNDDGSCDPTQPAVFIDIAQYTNWILSVIN